MSDLRALIEAARADGPSAAARAKVWAGVSTVVGEAATVGAARAERRPPAPRGREDARARHAARRVGHRRCRGGGAVRASSASQAGDERRRVRPGHRAPLVSTPAAAPARVAHPDPASERDAGRDRIAQPESCSCGDGRRVPPSRVATLEAGASKRVALSERANFAGASAKTIRWRARLPCWPKPARRSSGATPSPRSKSCAACGCCPFVSSSPKSWPSRRRPCEGSGSTTRRTPSKPPCDCATPTPSSAARARTFAERAFGLRASVREESVREHLSSLSSG